MAERKRLAISSRFGPFNSSSSVFSFAAPSDVKYISCSICASKVSLPDQIVFGILPLRTGRSYQQYNRRWCVPSHVPWSIPVRDLEGWRAPEYTPGKDH